MIILIDWNHPYSKFWYKSLIKYLPDTNLVDYTILTYSDLLLYFICQIRVNFLNLVDYINLACSLYRSVCYYRFKPVWSFAYRIYKFFLLIKYSLIYNYFNGNTFKLYIFRVFNWFLYGCVQRDVWTFEIYPPWLMLWWGLPLYPSPRLSSPLNVIRLHWLKCRFYITYFYIGSDFSYNIWNYYNRVWIPLTFLLNSN